MPKNEYIEAAKEIRQQLKKEGLYKPSVNGGSGDLVFTPDPNNISLRVTYPNDRGRSFATITFKYRPEIPGIRSVILNSMRAALIERGEV